MSTGTWKRNVSIIRRWWRDICRHRYIGIPYIGIPIYGIGIPYIFVQRTHGDEDDDDDDNDKWRLMQRKLIQLTYWGRVTHICVGKQTIIVSDNGLSPGRRQAIIWTNAGILLIGPLGTNFSEILIGIQTFSFKKMHLKMSSAKWRPFVSVSNVLSLLKAMGKTCRVTLTETQHKNKLSRN